MKNAAVIQAAGKGSRFLSDQYKLLAPVGGVPMILRTSEAVLQAGFDEVVIVVGFRAADMREVLAGLPVRIVENPDWEKGQSTSLSAGVRAVQDTSDRVCLLLGDQPFLRPETLRALIEGSESHPGEIIVPFYQGKRGNPIVVPSVYYEELLSLTEGDEGGRKLLKTAGYRELSVDDPGVLRDIDTVGELKRYE
ncbi:MAG: nucleotidyltransferase family protein [Flexilinea sp.]|nr:nucleotidyltransferase family protein [Flexilinea sp.]